MAPIIVMAIVLRVAIAMEPIISITIAMVIYILAATML